MSNRRSWWTLKISATVSCCWQKLLLLLLLFHLAMSKQQADVSRHETVTHAGTHIHLHTHVTWRLKCTPINKSANKAINKQQAQLLHPSIPTFSSDTLMLPCRCLSFVSFACCCSCIVAAKHKTLTTTSKQANRQQHSMGLTLHSGRRSPQFVSFALCPDFYGKRGFGCGRTACQCFSALCS